MSTSGRGVSDLEPNAAMPVPGIDDEEPLAAADLDAGRVAAELDELRTRRTGRAPDSPESNLECIRTCITPRHHGTLITVFDLRMCAIHT